MPQSEPLALTRRLATMDSSFRHPRQGIAHGPLAATAFLCVALAMGCGAAATAIRSEPPSQSAIPSPSIDPSHPTDGRPSPDSSPMPVSDAARAAALVLRSDPRFAGIGPLLPDLVGQSSWYEAGATNDGFAVMVRIGWGDCPSGCIDRHEWHYAVTPDGAITLEREAGELVPVDIRPPAVEGEGRLEVVLVAGPTCAVETMPPRPGCDPAKVADAVLRIRDADGRLVGESVSDDEGGVTARLASGVYVLEPQAVEGGYLGTAEPAATWVLPGDSFPVTLTYDTGIR